MVAVLPALNLNLKLKNPDFQPNGEAPVSASAIAIKGELMTPEGSKPYTVPRALEEAELPALIEDYRKGARNALDAGFDGAVPIRVT